jgi:hypothetical protein
MYLLYSLIVALLVHLIGFSREVPALTWTVTMVLRWASAASCLISLGYRSLRLQDRGGLDGGSS